MKLLKLFRISIHLRKENEKDTIPMPVQSVQLILNFTINLNATFDNYGGDGVD